MLMLIIFILLSIEVSTINGVRCACCFPEQIQTCQTPGFDIPSCAVCTSDFCANHVKGCQGPRCKAECQLDSSSTTTPATSSSSTGPIINSTTGPIISSTTGPIISSTTGPIISSTTGPVISSTSVPIISSTPNGGNIVQTGVLIISACLILMSFVQLNF